MRRQGRAPHSRLLRRELRPARPDEARDLRLRDGEPVVGAHPHPAGRRGGDRPRVGRPSTGAARPRSCTPTSRTGSLHEALRAAGFVPARGRATIAAEAASRGRRPSPRHPARDPAPRRTPRHRRPPRAAPRVDRVALPGRPLRPRRRLRGRGRARAADRAGAGPPVTGSRARVRAALEHREPDRVPRDLGAVRMTGIHVRAYAGLRRALGLPERDVRLGDVSQQLAVVDDDVLDRLGIDVRGVEPRGPSGYRREIVDDGEEMRVRRRVGRPPADAEERRSTSTPRRRRSAARSTPATWPASPGPTAPTPPGAPASPRRHAASSPRRAGPSTSGRSAPASPRCSSASAASRTATWTSRPTMPSPGRSWSASSR